MERTEFVKKYSPAVARITSNTGVSPQVLFAQAILESSGKDDKGKWGVGQSQLAKKYNKEMQMDDSKTSTVDVDGQSDEELYDALYDMGYDFGEFGSDDFDEEGFADTAIDLGYRYDDKNKVWNHRDDDIEESSTKLTSMIKKIKK